MDYEHRLYTTVPVYDEYPQKTDDPSVPITAFIAIGVLAASENAIALIIVITSERFRKKRNIFLFSLSLADFIAGIMSFLFFFDKFYESQMFGAVLDAMFLISMLSISAVCIERYIAIVFAPFTYKSIITFKRCVAVCVMFWILTLSVILVVYAFKYNKWTRALLSIALLFTIIVNYILYFRISMALRRSDINVTNNLGRNVIGRHQKLIRSFIILLFIASICWLPLCVFFIIAVFSDNVNNNIFILNVLYCISLSNSFINPFIYWYSLPGMKDGFYDIIRLLRPRRKSKNGQTQNNSLQTVSSV